jgi:hypothetical protein
VQLCLFGGYIPIYVRGSSALCDPPPKLWEAWCHTMQVFSCLQGLPRGIDPGLHMNIEMQCHSDVESFEGINKCPMCSTGML